ncbi:MAG: patatin-like phospholipase family protein [Kiritimatiellaeota bacterium]|nr:patatin-like phospholipase family protein [Kiritimatiellota bacterium]
MQGSSKRETVALVLGSGGARGWAHVGVLRTLADWGVRPDIIVGASIGSVAGALHAAGALEKAEQVAETLDWRRTLKLFIEMNLPHGGLLKGTRIMEMLRDMIPVETIERLPVRYAAVATDLRTQKEVVLSKGDLLNAIRASIAIPGVFVPFEHRKGVWLVDGGLTNPLPVSVARAMGATRVIGVDINLSGGADDDARTKRGAPSLMEVMIRSFRVVENTITRERLLREPPDILIQPRVAAIGTLEFHKGPEAIRAGCRAAREQENAIRSLP